MVDYKIRPALVVSNNFFNKKFDAWFCPVTTSKMEECVPLESGFAGGELDRESFAKTNVITTIENVLLLKKIGKLKKEKVLEIVKRIEANF